MRIKSEVFTGGGRGAFGGLFTVLFSTGVQRMAVAEMSENGGETSEEVSFQKAFTTFVYDSKQ